MPYSTLHLTVAILISLCQRPSSACSLSIHLLSAQSREIFRKSLARHLLWEFLAMRQNVRRITAIIAARNAVNSLSCSKWLVRKDLLQIRPAQLVVSLYLSIICDVPPIALFAKLPDQTITVILPYMRVTHTTWANIAKSLKFHSLGNPLGRVGLVFAA